MSGILTPLKQLKVSHYQIPAHGLTPNTSIQNKPLMLYHKVFKPNTSASAIEAHLDKTGVVSPSWRFTMYSYSHFHSTSHETLCVYSGAAKLCFGGESNPERVELVAEAGDALIIPAGVTHRLLEDQSGTFSMVGSYPKGLHYDMCYGQPAEKEKIKRIAELGWFESDPIYGHEGSATEL